MPKRIISLLLIILIISGLSTVFAQDVLEISAPSAILIEMQTGKVLYEKNAHDILPPASVTKVMTMLLIMEAIDDGTLKYDDMVVASQRAKSMGGSTIFLDEGETLSVEDMLKGIAVASGNDASVAMAEHISGSVEAFVEKMNKKAFELGMKDTNFVNCNGLDDDSVYNTTSAYDIALMSRELMLKHSDIKKFTTIWMDSLRDGKFQLANTNKLVRFYDGATGLKTGSTSKAKNCLSATATRNGLSLIAVIMKAPTSKDRFSDASKLLNYGFGAYKIDNIVKKGEKVCAVKVKKGNEDEVSLIASDDYSYLTEKNNSKKIEKNVVVKDYYTAPLKSNDKAGKLEIVSDGKVINEIDLVYEKNIQRKKLLIVFKDLILNWSGRRA
ncbi:MAG: D-alanyl-D-alanine carboxypeptidase [Ruminococcaceae bacterium]|nr:D-alanyl-D-alanine carboxypeptidase [Oscillospiraceae bacterium]